jgi:hypothetical protein
MFRVAYKHAVHATQVPQCMCVQLHCASACEYTDTSEHVNTEVTTYRLEKQCSHTVSAYERMCIHVCTPTISPMVNITTSSPVSEYQHLAKPRMNE